MLIRIHALNRLLVNISISDAILSVYIKSTARSIKHHDDFT